MGEGSKAEDEYPQPLLCLKPDINLSDLYDLRHRTAKQFGF
jgi:hypothetical protein